MSAKSVFHTATWGARKFPTLVIIQWMTAGCPLALASTKEGTKFLENMYGWNCSAASRIQNRPRTICKTRWDRTSRKAECASGGACSA
jgi:hypothetical protein